MTSKRRPYKTYPKEFQLEDVRMIETSDRPASEIAAELGIRRNLLYKWKEQLERKGESSFKGKPGRPPKSEQSEEAALRQENERLREEVEILKKAAAYFARELK